ncbi:MAG TPA: hypothetical protein VGN12_05730 [Pirellulales bacterium]|jgi:hypothetical protein
MKRLLAFCLAVTLVGLCSGCEKKAEVKKTTTISSPEGKTTETDTTKIETSGKNPPAANP